MQKSSELDTTSHLLEWLKLKSLWTVNVGKEREQLKPINTAGGSVKWYNQLEYSLAVSYKVKYNLPYDPEIILLGIYPRKMK